MNTGSSISTRRISRAAFSTSAAAFASIGAVRSAGSAAQFEFKCAGNQPLDHPTSIRQIQMWKAIERESGGRIHTSFFPANQLGGDAALLSQLRVGAIEFLVHLPILATLVSAVDLTLVGFAFKDEAEALHVMDGPLGEYLRNEFAAKGIYSFPKFWASGMRQITTSHHPIRTPEDMHGFKIRVISSKIIVDFYKTLGASPTPLSYGEVYTALQTKIVDGEDAPLASIEVTKFYEVQKYLSMTNHTWSGLLLMANPDVWKSLPPDLQGIIARNNTKYALIQRRDVSLLNASVADKLSRQGLAINKVDTDPFRLQLKSYYSTWAKEFGPTAWGLLQNSTSGKLG